MVYFEDATNITTNNASVITQGEKIGNENYEYEINMSKDKKAITKRKCEITKVNRKQMC